MKSRFQRVRSARNQTIHKKQKQLFKKQKTKTQTNEDDNFDDGI
jgi:hypothetical protein